MIWLAYEIEIKKLAELLQKNLGLELISLSLNIKEKYFE